MQTPDGKTSNRIVIFSYNRDFGMSVANWLGEQGYLVVYAHTLDIVLKELSETKPRGILFDRSLSDAFGAEAFHLLRAICPDVPAVTLSPSAGAHPSVFKPSDSLRLSEFLAELTPTAKPPLSN